MELIDLKAKTRRETGKGAARRLRREGIMPGVFYGPGAKTTPLSLEIRGLENILRKHNMAQLLLKLKIEDGGQSQTKSSMIKELQTDPISGDLLHVDLYEIAMDRKISVAVPVVTTGEAVGVERGGILQVVRRELEVYCLPNKIPESFELDISELDIGDAIHVEDIPVEEGVEIPADVNFTVVTVSTPTRIELPEEAEEEAEAGLEAEEGMEEEAGEAAEADQEEAE